MTAPDSLVTGPPSSEDGDLALLVDMHQVGGGLFLTGGILVFTVFGVSSWSADHRAVLFATAIGAVLAGALLLLAPRHRLLPRWVFPWLAVLGAVNVTVTILAVGKEGSAPFSVLYVFVTIFSFYYFRGAVAIGLVAFAASCNLAAFYAVGVAQPVAQWVIVTVGTVITGWLIGRVGQRNQDLLDQQRDVVERLRELDELRTAFLRAVSHELRTPLTAVAGFTEMLRLRDDDLSPSQRAVMVEKISKNAAKLENLLTNLLDIDRISRGVVQPLRHPTDLGALVRRTVDEIRVPTHTIEIVLDGDLEIDVEASKVERLVENLVANACRHTPAGTNVLVTVAGFEDRVDVRVEDDGPGLQGVDAESAFQPFAQGVDASMSPSPGTGIGLALVSNFTRLHDGVVEAGASSMGGASFVVRLPRVEVQNQPSPVEVTTEG